MLLLWQQRNRYKLKGGELIYNLLKLNKNIPKQREGEAAADS